MYKLLESPMLHAEVECQAHLVESGHVLNLLWVKLDLLLLIGSNARWVVCLL